MTYVKLKRIFLVLLLLLGTISSITFYYLFYQSPHKVPLRARQVLTWPAGGAEFG